MPTFTWAESEEIDNLPIINMKIEFNDNGLPDVAILNRDPTGIDNEEAENECILTGFLRDEDSPVTVAGCPGSNTFDVCKAYFLLNFLSRLETDCFFITGHHPQRAFASLHV